MFPTFSTRSSTRNDIPGFRRIIDATELFPSDYLPDMMSAYFGDPATQDIWLTAIDADGEPIGLVFASPEPMTNGSFNARLLAVDPRHHGKGVAVALMDDLETSLRSAGHRVLVVETSGSEAQRKARSFYAKAGFERIGRIAEFWDEGDDKVIFAKKLK